MLTSALILVPPRPAKPLFLYVAATTQVVSATVVVERLEEGHTLLVQRSVYFINEVLSEIPPDPKTNLRSDSRSMELKSTQSHQVSSTGRLHRRMDRHPTPPCSSPGGTLDDLLRRVTHEDGG